MIIIKLELIFKLIFILMIFFAIISPFLMRKEFENMENKGGNQAVEMTNINAGKIQQLRDDINKIKNTFENIKPLQKDVETNEKVITNLQDTNTQKQTESSLDG